MKTHFQVCQFLPNVPSVEDACVQRLAGSLKSRSGVHRVHVIGSGQRACLCVHFSAEETNRTCILEVAQKLARQLASHIGHVRWQVLSEVDAALLAEAAKLLRSLQGVLEAHIDEAGTIRAEYFHDQTGPGTIQAVLREAGIETAESKASE